MLVDSNGRTLYTLTSEKGATSFTCRSGNGCTSAWPPVTLPSGDRSAAAGTGIAGSRLGAAKDPDGAMIVTYDGWPLYTYSGDSGPGQANGEGLSSFGGTWYLLGTDGQPVTSASGGSGGGTTSTTRGGYGY